MKKILSLVLISALLFFSCTADGVITSPGDPAKGTPPEVRWKKDSDICCEIVENLIYQSVRKETCSDLEGTEVSMALCKAPSSSSGTSSSSSGGSTVSCNDYPTMGTCTKNVSAAICVNSTFGEPIANCPTAATKFCHGRDEEDEEYEWCDEIGTGNCYTSSESKCTDDGGEVMNKASCETKNVEFYYCK